MTSEKLPFEAVCRVLRHIPDDVAHHGGSPPEPWAIYVVPAHEKALHPDIPLVVGGRGVGKSFWSAALNGPKTRRLIGRRFQRLALDKARISWGFSAERGRPDHPSRQTLEHLLQQGFSAEAIWRTVVLWHVDPFCEQTLPAGSWEERVSFTVANTESEEAMLRRADQALLESRTRQLIVFDALDRLAANWAGIRELVQGLLRVCLDLRPFRNIRVKIFMRPDMWEDITRRGFPDASKLFHSHALLQWRRVDLYGLLWHWLANCLPEEGEAFRSWCAKAYGLRFDAIRTDDGDNVYMLPSKLGSDEKTQARVLGAIASPFMGQNRRRGKTYTWVPTYLADAKGEVSPRSFLLAVKRAEEASRERRAQAVLHFDGLKKGVQDASRMRKLELMEDYPWIDQVLDPLRGMTVPCTREELIRRWHEAGVAEAIRHPGGQTDDAKAYLPPYALEDRLNGRDPEEALLDELLAIGVLSRVGDGRFNIPDLFRVAAGIGRKGGVRAIR